MVNCWSAIWLDRQALGEELNLGHDLLQDRLKRCSCVGFAPALSKYNDKQPKVCKNYQTG